MDDTHVGTITSNVAATASTEPQGNVPGGVSSPAPMEERKFANRTMEYLTILVAGQNESRADALTEPYIAFG